MTTKFKCEHYNAEDDSVFVCKNCDKLRLKLPKYDFYSALGMKVEFAPDLDLLEEKYEEMMEVLHPDLFVNASESEKAASIKYSAILQEAKKTLSTPVASAFYILKLFDKAHTKDLIRPSQSFLQEMFLLNEEFNENKEDPQFLHKITKMYEDRLLTLKKLFAEFFKNSDFVMDDLYENLGQFKFISNLYYNATGEPQKAHF